MSPLLHAWFLFIPGAEQGYEATCWAEVVAVDPQGSSTLRVTDCERPGYTMDACLDAIVRGARGFVGIDVLGCSLDGAYIDVDTAALRANLAHGRDGYETTPGVVWRRPDGAGK